MIFEICAIASVIVFALLAFYIIRTLCALQRSLKDISLISYDLAEKLKLLDSTFKSISTLGEMSEIKIKQLRDHESKLKELKYRESDYTDDLTDVILAALKLGTKYFRR